MSFGELIDTFHGLPVVDFNGPNDWQGPDRAYRLREEYEDKLTNSDRLNLLLEQSGIEGLKALIIGACDGMGTGDCGSCKGEMTIEDQLQMLISAAPKLPGVRALFFGEMTYEENEVSWIVQTNLSPLLLAYPALENLRVRGAEELSFSPIEHQSLKELAIETGGLPRSVIRELFLCQFPALEHFELLLGSTNYGFDGSVEDLQPVLSGKLHPKLKYLGLMNSEIANDIAAVVVNSPIAGRIETLDLSMGNLDDEGFQSLHALSQYPQLKKVILSHHYATEEGVAALQAALKCEVDASDPQSPDDDWRPIVHAE